MNVFSIVNALVLLAYEFVIIHHLAAMMQDVDGVSRYSDLLVHRYTITASRLHAEDVTERLFVYSFDVFHSCNNLRHVTASDALSVSITIATHPSISTIYHTPIKFSTIFSICPVLAIEHQSTDCHPLPIPGALLLQSLGYRLIRSSIFSPIFY